MHWQTTRFQIDLSRPRVMGIVNVTPDSFSDGGQHASAAAAIEHCERLVLEGVDILDIGGESSRPGAISLSLDEEWTRIAPVVSAALTMGVPVSVDTCKAEIMGRAMGLGVDVINDIHALQEPRALMALAAHDKCGVCLMHMRGSPQIMQSLTDYDDLLADVSAFLAARVAALRSAHIAQNRIVIDPGYGFAKTTEQNFELLARQAELLDLGYPLLAGWSRKRALGDVTGRKVEQRLAGSLAAGLAAIAQGTKILRVHDVAATVDAIKVWMAASACGATRYLTERQ
ncbi:dihydropteroate synthase [Roseateles oligotrophus]|uniref:Dihydropteroate synthase n=1 Tax=Roseateles oligotrophus TaxID=1769250 RepID=A0ABT2YLP9_9BURK|nr:dihydropteroate synthase [Roseateles oligotrophus]MCV2370987.1 dihydropteroate synthase [Roseateles oligotrophus]